MKADMDMTDSDDPAFLREDETRLTRLTCPDCGGVLWEIDDLDILRFRCRTGHAWTVGSLTAEQDTAVEEALWASLRALEDTAALAERGALRP